MSKTSKRTSKTLTPHVTVRHTSFKRVPHKAESTEEMIKGCEDCTSVVGPDTKVQDKGTSRPDPELNLTMIIGIAIVRSRDVHVSITKPASKKVKTDSNYEQNFLQYSPKACPKND